MFLKQLAAATAFLASTGLGPISVFANDAANTSCLRIAADSLANAPLGGVLTQHTMGDYGGVFYLASRHWYLGFEDDRHRTSYLRIASGGWGKDSGNLANYSGKIVASGKWNWARSDRKPLSLQDQSDLQAAQKVMLGCFADAKPPSSRFIGPSIKTSKTAQY